jgi:hypothetical protein
VNLISHAKAQRRKGKQRLVSGDERAFEPACSFFIVPAALFALSFEMRDPDSRALRTKLLVR